MAKPYDTHNHEVFQEHPMITELLAELQAIEEKGRVEARFYALIAWISHMDGPYHNDREFPVDVSTWERSHSMVPGLIMWLLGVPLVVIVLLFIFRVI
jgi:hypothetical protein